MVTSSSGEADAGFVVFARAGSPSIGFPVKNKEVAYEYYQTLVEAFEGEEGEERQEE